MRPNAPAVSAHRGLLLWNRFYLAVLLSLSAAWGLGYILQGRQSHVATVEGHWSGDTLRFSSMRGFVVVTHLVGVSGRTQVGAVLPAPLLLLDSGGASVDKTVWKKLRWRGDSGAEEPAPPIGSEITGLYQTQQATRWRPATARP